MSVPSLGYGSEWHMLRFLGRHRAHLTKEVLAVTGGDALEWLDFGFTPGISRSDSYGDSEITGLEFLSPTDPARLAWGLWWPQRGAVHHWDAVGIHTHKGVHEWLLVEAKGNIEELESHCGAKPASEGGGRDRIEGCLAATRATLGITGIPPDHWLSPYYQYANRLAMLHFLSTEKVPARLLFIYFVGDSTENVHCPSSAAEWAAPLQKMKDHLGLPKSGPLLPHIHELFLPVV